MRTRKVVLACVVLACIAIPLVAAGPAKKKAGGVRTQSSKPAGGRRGPAAAFTAPPARTPTPKPRTPRAKAGEQFKAKAGALKGKQASASAASKRNPYDAYAKTEVTPEQSKTIEYMLRRSAESPLIKMSSSDYQRYILSFPRPFGVVVLFTANEKGALPNKQDCQLCRQLTEEVEALAASWWMNRDAASGRLFFVMVDFKDNQQAFQYHQLQSVPGLIHMPPYASKKKPKDGKIYDQEDVCSFKQGLHAEALGKWVAERAPFRLVVFRSPMKKFALGMALCAVCFIMFFFGKKIAAKVVRESKYIVLTVAMLVYWLSISGIMFDIIHTPPFYYIHPYTGKYVFISPGARQQFILEGLIAGLLSMVAAMGLIMLIDVVPRIRKVVAQYFVAMIAFGFVGCFLFLVKLYWIKAPYYMMVTE
eukprot:tig00000076_g2407.t1